MEKQLVILSALILLLQTLDAGQFYTSENGDQYYVEKDKRFDWYDAVKECTSQNMTLVTPDTPARQFEISKVFDHFAITSVVWTSGQEDANKQIVWTTTGNKLNFTNWKRGERFRKGSDPRCILISRFDCAQWILFPCRNYDLVVMCEKIPQNTQNLNELKQLPENAGPKGTHATSGQEAVQTLDLELLKSFYKNQTDFLLAELKKFYEMQLDVFKKSHASEMHHLLEEKTREMKAEVNVNLVALNQSLVQIKEYVEESHEFLSNRTNVEKIII